MKTCDVHIRITEEKLNKIKAIAAKQYRKVTSIIDEALDLFLKKNKKG